MSINVGFPAGTSSINDLGSVPLDKIPDGAVSRDGEDASEDFESRNKGSQLSTSSPGVHPRKSLKVPRSSSSSLCSKRPRVVQLEDSLFLSGADDAKDASDKLGSYLKKCNSHGNVDQPRTNDINVHLFLLIKIFFLNPSRGVLPMQSIYYLFSDRKC